MKTYAYLRVSSKVTTDRQSTDSQRHAIREYAKSKGIKIAQTFQDYATGLNVRRESLQSLLAVVREGDSILVTDLSRFSRSVKDTLTLVEQLTKRGVSLTLVNQGLTFDKSAMSNFMLAVFAALSELESKIKGERTKAGLALARKNGVQLGRKRNDKKRAEIQKMSKSHTVQEIADKYGTTRQAIYYMLREKGSPMKKTA